VLEDDAEHPHLLETVPKRGYRFHCAIEGASEERERPAIVSSPASKQIRGKLLPWRRIWMLLGAAGALVLVALSLRYSRHKRVSPKLSPAIQSIAVFTVGEPLSADAAQEYFSDGLTDELITEPGKDRKPARHLPNFGHSLTRVGIRELLKSAGSCMWMPSWKARWNAWAAGCGSGHS